MLIHYFSSIIKVIFHNYIFFFIILNIIKNKNYTYFNITNYLYFNTIIIHAEALEPITYEIIFKNSFFGKVK